MLEPKPGVEPSPSHLQSVLATLKSTPAKMVSACRVPGSRSLPNGSPATPASPIVKLPFTVGGSDAAKDLFGLFDDTVARLLAGAAKP